jgi:hypothetical protein
MPLHKRNLTRFAGTAMLAVALGAGFSGCASSTRHTVKVDSMTNPSAVSGYAYTMASGSSKRGDARYDNVAEQVKLALSQRGMYEAPTPADADVVIDFDYGEHPPQTHVSTVQEPVTVMPGQPYPNTNLGSQTGPSITLGPGGGVYPGNGINNSNAPQTVMVESTRVTQTTEKYIRINARENAAAKNRPRNAPPPQQVWTVEATLEDESTNFNEVLPAMIDAAIDYIGVNSRGQQKVVVTSGS